MYGTLYQRESLHIHERLLLLVLGEKFTRFQ